MSAEQIRPAGNGPDPTAILCEMNRAAVAGAYHHALDFLAEALALYGHQITDAGNGSWSVDCAWHYPPFWPLNSPVTITPRPGDVVWIGEGSRCPCYPDQIIRSWRISDPRIIPHPRTKGRGRR